MVVRQYAYIVLWVSVQIPRRYFEIKPATMPNTRPRKNSHGRLDRLPLMDHTGDETITQGETFPLALRTLIWPLIHLA